MPPKPQQPVVHHAEKTGNVPVIIVCRVSFGVFEQRKALLRQMVAFFNEKYGAGTVEVTPHDVYYNMLEKIQDGHMDIVDLAKEAMQAAGVTPRISPIRGDTDGAQLSFRGLPCPNLFTGDTNFHGRYEYLPIPSLEKACETVIEIAKRASQHS